jgi:hypothetical protein
MLLLDGIEYEVKTPDENLDDVVTYINDYCQMHDIKNSLGETIYIDANEANPFYQMLRGLSYLTTIMQKLQYSAGCSVSVAESSERQLLNLSDIAGIKRTKATHTTIAGVVYANLEEQGAVPCVITREMEASITIAGVDVVFHPAFDVTIPIGESRNIVLVADRLGSFNISANTITNFDDPVPGLRMLATGASTPGQERESIASLRERLQRRTIEGTQIERAASAIQNLEGVAMCSIYFNYSPRENETVPYGDTNITVPPRQALVFVQGWSTDPVAIARTFYRYLLCKTAGGDVAEHQEQIYETKAGQRLTVNILPPKQQPVWIKIYIKNVLSYEQVDGIKDVICSMAGNLTIGQSISSVDVIKYVSNIYTNLTVQGAEIALTDDSNAYSYVQVPNPTSVFYLNVDNITVVEV